MGVVQTEWEGEYGSHTIHVRRNEITRGFHVEVDRMIIAYKRFALFGTGEVEGSAQIDGRFVTVRVKLIVGEGCIIHVDGKQIPVALAK